ncbi:MAG: TonB-dependent receptor [Kiritimatiellaceae bacterium]|nr:TonB-dependent receptor [Kiritimatiellaceae bacterium]
MGMMKKRILTAALSGALFTGTFAETTNTVTDAERIVITATRSASDVRNVPGNPSVVTAQDIADGHYTSVPEALEKKAGIFFRNYADNPSQAAVDIRGFGGDNPHGKVLVLVNGRKLNRPDMAVINWAQIPMQAVERIEVVRGPNSVLYGDHAVGGVINIITRDGADIPETSLQASAGSYGAFDQNVVTSGKLDGLGYVATAGHQSGDGYRNRSAYDTSSGSLRLSGAINEQVSAYAEGSVVKERHELPGALSLAQVQQNRRQAANLADEADETYYTFNTGVKVVPTDELIFDLDGGMSRKDLQADMPSYWPASYYDYKINSYTLSPKVTLLTPVANMDNEFILGSDLARETLVTKKYNDLSRTVLATDTKVTKDLIGGYIADTLSLTDKLLLSGGARLEQNKVNAHHENGAGVTQYDDSITHTKKAWQTALNWMPTDTLKLFTGVKSTYRYPFIDEQAIYSGWGDAFNKDLRPETGINYETGVEVTPVSNVVLQATAFQTDMKDEIAWGAGKNENLDKTTHRGVELHAGYKNEAFAIDGYYTWLQSEFTAGVNNGNEIPWVPQNKLDVNLALFLTGALTLNTHMSYVSSMYPSGDNSNSAGTLSDYTIFDSLLEYKLPIKKFETKVFAGVDNIFATKYNFLAYSWGYYPAPERTYKAGLNVKF